MSSYDDYAAWLRGQRRDMTTVQQQQEEARLMAGRSTRTAPAVSATSELERQVREALANATREQILAATQQAIVPPAPAPPPPAPVVDTSTDHIPAVFATSVLADQTRRIIVVVGAGGSGTRVISPLSQMLTEGDHLCIIDHDTVEERNLLRQMFAPADVGMHKALVAASRYRRPGLTTSSYTQRLSQETLTSYTAHLSNQARSMTREGLSPAVIIIGCVDNWQARSMITSLCIALNRSERFQAIAYIDIGNETRSGQVLMNLSHWPLKVKTSRGASTSNFTLNAFAAMPQLLRQGAWRCATCDVESTALACPKCGRDEDSCGDRIDLQTVMVNHMASAAALNCVATLLNGIPFTNAGAFFSTVNSMTPIKLAGIMPNTATIVPETTYAIPA